MCLEDLREFLQEEIATSYCAGDDVVIEQLQASMSELRKMKLDLPPPGTQNTHTVYTQLTSHKHTSLFGNTCSLVDKMSNSPKPRTGVRIITKL